MAKTVDILGTKVTVEFIKVEDDPTLQGKLGYYDQTTKRIVIAQAPEGAEVGNIEVLQKQVLRHELLHAFMYESGLGDQTTGMGGHDEQIIDWFALQAPKIVRVYEELGVLE